MNLATFYAPFRDSARRGRPPRDGKLRVALPVPPTPSEELLLAIARHRDRQAFTQLFGRFAPRVKGQLMAAGTDPGSAEELAQEVMLNVWRKASLYDPRRGAASTWIFAMTRNRFLNANRRRGSTPGGGGTLREPLDSDGRLGDAGAEASGRGGVSGATDDGRQPETDLLVGERDRLLNAALGELPEEQRTALRAAYFSGRSLREVAQEQNIPLGTVKTRLRLALERLRKVIAPGWQP